MANKAIPANTLAAMDQLVTKLMDHHARKSAVFHAQRLLGEGQDTIGPLPNPQANQLASDQAAIDALVAQIRTDLAAAGITL